MMSIFRPMRGPDEYKTLNLELNREQGSIFLTAQQGTKGKEYSRIPFRLTVSEALELAFKLRLAARVVIMEEMDLAAGGRE